MHASILCVYFIGNPGSCDFYVDTGADVKCKTFTLFLEEGSKLFVNGTVTCTGSLVQKEITH